MFYPDALESSEAETETSSKGDSANKEEQPAAEPSVAAAMPPSMYLLPPEEESMPDAANDEEKVIGTVAAMPISDNYVNMFDHQQVNDDKFDLVEEDEKENTAQEVLDEQVQDAEASQTVPQEAVDSTQEVEVNDESNESGEASSNVDEEILDETPESLVEDEGTNEIVSEIESDDKNDQEEPAAVLTEEVQPEYQSQLHNDVQEVEESEPVVQDVQEDEPQQQPEVTEVEVPQAIESISSNDVVIKKEEESNSVETSPSDNETHNEPTQKDEPKLPLSIEETAPNSENVVAEIELNDDSQEESEVNEPLVAESPVVVVADGDDEKVDDSEAVPAEASSEQELVLESDEKTPADDQNETVMNEVHPLTATLAELVAEQSHPIDLPEFIVSTVADLRRGVVPPALRRRKTFLFKADAISS